MTLCNMPRVYEYYGDGCVPFVSCTRLIDGDAHVKWFLARAYEGWCLENPCNSVWCQ